MNLSMGDGGETKLIKDLHEDCSSAAILWSSFFGRESGWAHLAPLPLRGRRLRFAQQRGFGWLAGWLAF
jgi:hypothetical protein